MYGHTRAGTKYTISPSGEIQIPVSNFGESHTPSSSERNNKMSNNKITEKKDNKPEICPVFRGKGYAEWKQRLKMLLAKEGLKSARIR